MTVQGRRNFKKTYWGHDSSIFRDILYISGSQIIEFLL